MARKRIQQNRASEPLKEPKKGTGAAQLDNKPLSHPDVENRVMELMGNILVRGFPPTRAARQLACEIINEHPEITHEAHDWRALVPYAMRVFGMWREQDKELAPYQATYVTALLMDVIQLTKNGGEVVQRDGTKERIKPNMRVCLESIKYMGELAGLTEPEGARAPVVNMMIGNIDVSLLQNVPADVIAVADTYAKEIRQSALAAIRGQEQSVLTTAKQLVRKIG